MAHVVISSARTEVPDEQAHGITGAMQLAVGPTTAVGLGQQMPIGPGRIGVGYHDVRLQLEAIGEPHSCGGAVAHDDGFNVVIEKQLATLPLQEIDHSLDQLAGASRGKVNAEAALEEGNE